MKRNLSAFVALLGVLVPAVSFAQAPRDFRGVVYLFLDLVTLLIPIVGAIALLVFFWGLAKFILHSDNEDSVREGKWVMVSGIVGLFVMISIWGIVSLVQSDLFGGSTNGLQFLPTN